MIFKILYCEDNLDYITEQFDKIQPEDIVEYIKKDGSNQQYIDRFLGRIEKDPQNIVLSSVEVKNYDMMLKAIEGEHKDARLLLLDCHIEGVSENGGEEIVGEVLDKIELGMHRVCILATSHEASVIAGQIEDEKKGFILSGRGGLSKQNLLSNIKNGILLYESLQESDRYNNFFNELMGDNNRDYCKHPINDPNYEASVDDNPRKEIYLRHFREEDAEDGGFNWVKNSILYSIAHSKIEQLDLRCAWFLSKMKFEVMFGKGNGEGIFVRDENLKLGRRWLEEGTLPFVSYQAAPDRLITLIAFGNMCEKLFRRDAKDPNFDPGNFKGRCALLKMELKSNPINPDKHQMTWVLDYGAEGLNENIIKKYRQAFKAVDFNDGSHNNTSSLAITSFFVSTSLARSHGPEPNFLVGGNSVRLKISLIDNNTKTKFEFYD